MEHAVSDSSPLKVKHTAANRTNVYHASIMSFKIPYKENPVRPIAFALCLLFCLSSGAESSNKMVRVQAGVSPVVSTAGFFIAKEKKFFEDEGLDVELQVFQASSAPMNPLLAKGELDVGGGNLTAGLFTANEAGANVKIVADKGSVRENADYIKLLVRKDLIESGRYKSLKDLKGLKMSFTALGGTSQEAAAAVLLKKGGLKPTDVEFIKMSYSDSNKALALKTIDAVVQVEPFVTMAEQEGLAKAVTGVYAVYPGQQSAGVFYSPSFIKDKREAAVKFMRAYIRGCRAYNAAFSQGAKASEREEIVAILMKWTSLKDKSLYEKMTPAGLDRDGRLNMASLKQDAEYYLSQGYIKSAPAWDTIVDNHFVDEAVKTLGAAKK